MQLDIAMFAGSHVALANEHDPDAALPKCNPAAQLGSRLLIKYLRYEDGEKYNKTKGLTHYPGEHWLTPTPIAPQDLVTVLGLPAGTRKYCWALLLDPAKLTDVIGPRRIKGGYGMEYIVLNGFSSDAIEGPGWPIMLR